MQFMSRQDQAYPTEERPMARMQEIVLRHIYLLLGYSQIDKSFHISSFRLRYSAVFNAFITNLPQVMDQNHLIGWTLLPVALQVLLYSPKPGNGTVVIESTQNITYNYSLWFLEPHIRRSWLMTALVVLYKYQYTQAPYSGQVNYMIRIVLNSLQNHFHRCKRIPGTLALEAFQLSRAKGMVIRVNDLKLYNSITFLYLIVDASHPSLGAECDDLRIDATPPASPLVLSEGKSSAANKAKKSQTVSNKNIMAMKKYHDSSLDVDETESELVAIPESDLSDSTLQGSSAPGSFDDNTHIEEYAMPFKSEILRNKVSAHVTTAGLAVGQVAISTVGMPEHCHEVSTFII